MPERSVSHRYVDPLDQIWLQAAEGVGLQVKRNRDVFAATDGAGTLWLAPPAALDADDCLAQMVLHELCHSLVMGPDSFQQTDWGLDNETDLHQSLEHACLRLQAALLEPLGLRQVLAPTTDYRAFYDALEADPFALAPGAVDDGSAIRARVALRRSEQPPWAPHLGRALEATAQVLHAVGRREGAREGTPSLSTRLEPRALPHPSGLRADSIPGRRCGECGWYEARDSAHRGRCRQAAGTRVEGSWPSCERFEPVLDCLACGACCREAYDVVAISLRDPASKKHRELMVMCEGRAEMQRTDRRCVALQGGAPLLPRLKPTDPEHPEPPLHMPSGTPFTCSIYDTRPRTCRDFRRAGENCLEARRRVGLSR